MGIRTLKDFCLFYFLSLRIEWLRVEVIWITVQLTWFNFYEYFYYPEQMFTGCETDKENFMIFKFFFWCKRIFSHWVSYLILPIDHILWCNSCSCFKSPAHHKSYFFFRTRKCKRCDNNFMENVSVVSLTLKIAHLMNVLHFWKLDLVSNWKNIKNVWLFKKRSVHAIIHQECQSETFNFFSNIYSKKKIKWNSKRVFNVSTLDTIIWNKWKHFSPYNIRNRWRNVKKVNIYLFIFWKFTHF